MRTRVMFLKTCTPFQINTIKTTPAKRLLAFSLIEIISAASWGEIKEARGNYFSLLVSLVSNAVKRK